MQCNVIRNGDVLTAETFPDLKKYLENNVVSLDSLIERQEEERIHKLIIKDAKCNMSIKEIKHLLKEYLMLNELKEIENMPSHPCDFSRELDGYRFLNT